MAKKILRQGMKVSVKELRDLADDMLKEGLETSAEIGLPDPKLLERKWLIMIINKEPKCSDTWEIENGREHKIGKKPITSLKKIRQDNPKLKLMLKKAVRVA